MAQCRACGGYLTINGSKDEGTFFLRNLAERRIANKDMGDKWVEWQQDAQVHPREIRNFQGKNFSDRRLTKDIKRRNLREGSFRPNRWLDFIQQPPDNFQRKQEGEPLGNYIRRLSEAYRQTYKDVGENKKRPMSEAAREKKRLSQEKYAQRRENAARKAEERRQKGLAPIKRGRPPARFQYEGN